MTQSLQPVAQCRRVRIGVGGLTSRVDGQLSTQSYSLFLIADLVGTGVRWWWCAGAMAGVRRGER
jgi:hypothetical protein